MSKKGFLNVIIFFIFLNIFASACSKGPEQHLQDKTEPESIDTGILIIKSTPSNAMVYIDGKFDGNTPLELYNFPIGSYDLLLRAEGYSDLSKKVTLTVGKSQEVEVVLIPVQTSSEEKKPESEEENETPEAQPLIRKG